MKRLVYLNYLFVLEIHEENNKSIQIKVIHKELVRYKEDMQLIY